jgi:hypothetical protein
MENNIDIETILENNDMRFKESAEDILKTASVDFLRKLGLIGLSSPVAEIGIELGVAALDELSRRAQLAEELSKRINKEV